MRERERTSTTTSHNDSSLADKFLQIKQLLQMQQNRVNLKTGLETASSFLMFFYDHEEIEIEMRQIEIDLFLICFNRT